MFDFQGREWRSAILVGVVSALPASGLFAQGSTARAEPLTGLTSFSVVIEGVSEDAMRLGLTKDRLQTLVERRLRQAGIALAPKAPSWLYFSGNVMGIKSGGTLVGFAAALRLEANTNVTIEESKKRAVGDVWYDATLFTGPAGDCVALVERFLNGQLDLFIEDYQKANPRAVR